jgi:hypothetical protein
MAAPARGIRKIIPKSIPQNIPPIAPAPVRLRNCRVFGLLASGCHDTDAASCTVIKPCLANPSNVPIAWLAAVQLSNFHTVSVPMPPLPSPPQVLAASFPPHDQDRLTPTG